MVTPVLTGTAYGDENSRCPGRWAFHIGVQRLQAVVCERQHDDGHRSRLRHDSGDPEEHETEEVAVDELEIGIGTARGRDHGAKLGIAESTDHREHPTNGPHHHCRAHAADTGQYTLWRHEDPRTDDDADVDCNAIEQIHSTFELHSALAVIVVLVTDIARLFVEVFDSADSLSCWLDVHLVNRLRQ